MITGWNAARTDSLRYQRHFVACMVNPMVKETVRGEQILPLAGDEDRIRPGQLSDDQVEIMRAMVRDRIKKRNREKGLNLQVAGDKME